MIDILKFILFACIQAACGGWKTGDLVREFKFMRGNPFGLRLNTLVPLPFGFVGHFYVFFDDDSTVKCKGMEPIGFKIYRG